jgi:hypothetical protein
VDAVLAKILEMEVSGGLDFLESAASLGHPFIKGCNIPVSGGYPAKLVRRRIHCSLQLLSTSPFAGSLFSGRTEGGQGEPDH